MYLMCPRCRSYFEMSLDALGKRGRKVRCTVCSKAWQARQKDLSDTLPQTEEASAPQPDSASTSAQHSSPAAASKPPPDLARAASIPPPQQEQEEDSIDRIEALTQHHRHAFAPLQFAERSIEQPLNNLLRFAFSWSVWILFLLALIYAIRTYPIEILHRFPNAIHFYERLNMSHPDFAKLLLNGSDYSMARVKVVSEYRLSRDLLNVRVFVGNRTDEEKPAPILRGTFYDAHGEKTGYFHFEPEQETLPAKGALEYSAQLDLPQPTSTTLTLTLLSLFEKQLDLGGSRLKVYNTKPPAPSASASVDEVRR